MHLLLLLATALAARVPLTVTVTGPDGAPLASTMVRFHEERETRVLPASGVLSVAALTTPDGGARDLALGGTVRFDVFAPGHGPSLMVLELKPGKANRARLILSASDFHTTGSMEGVEAVALMRRWEAAQLRWWNDRSDTNLVTAERLRAATGSKARAWVQAMGEAPHSDATRLCRITAPDITLCGEE